MTREIAEREHGFHVPTPSNRLYYEGVYLVSGIISKDKIMGVPQE